MFIYQNYTTNYLSFLKISIIILILLLELTSIKLAVATEPTIYISDDFSLALRDDGILFQFGGQPFTPAELDENVIVTLQPDKVILTDIDYLHYGYETGMFYSSFIVAITSENEAYIWNPNSYEQPKAIIDPVSGNVLSNIVEIFHGTRIFIITQDGNVYIFELGSEQATQLDELSDIKTITACREHYIYEDYFALNNSGNILHGQWDHSANRYTATKLKNTSGNNISNILTINNIFPCQGKEYDKYFALTNNGEIYTWNFVNDEYTGELKLTSASLVKDGTNIISGVTHTLIDSFYENELLALVEDQIYRWNWDSYSFNEKLDSPTLISGISNIERFYRQPYGDFAITNSGELYTLYGTTANYITGVSNVKTIYPSYAYDNLAITNDGNVYTWDNNKIATQITGLSNVDTLSNDGYHILALTKNGNVYFTNNVTQINGLSNITIITADNVNSYLAMQEDGILCWGDNYNGQLGIDPNILYYVDEPICGIEDLIVTT